MIFKLLTLLLASLSFGQQIKINQNETVDYILTYDSEFDNTGNTNVCFESVYHNSSSIMTHYHNLEECFRRCAYLDTCVGVYYDNNSTLLYDGCKNITNTTQFNETNKYNDTELYCYLLSDLGVGYRNTVRESSSLTKIKHFNYTHHYNNFTIPIYVMESYPENMHGNTTVYIDSNHNGVLDLGEPNISTRAFELVYFNNVSSGVHLVRTISPDFCHQLYPGMRGVELEYSLQGDGYVDNVQTYYHHGHSSFVSPHGGFVDTSEIHENSNFSYILGNDNSTYLSMYPGYNITLGFIDETVFSDLFITTYLNSSTWAHVSVSYNNLDYHYLGVLNVSNITNEISENYFNISTLELEMPIAFVRLHFMGNFSNVPLNIVGIHTSKDSIEAPEFAYLLGIPSDYYFALFYNNCYNDELCETYCFYMTRDFNSEESCLTGCNIFYNNNNCYCSELNKTVFEDFNGETFDLNWCNKGCHYELGWYVGPDFYPFEDKVGLEENIINTHTNCSFNCLDELIDDCYSNGENCSSFSLNSNDHGHTFGGYSFTESLDDIFIIRKDSVGNFSQLTSTSGTLTTTSGTLTSTSGTLTTTSGTLTSTSGTLTSTSGTLTTTSGTLTSTSGTLTTTSGTLTSISATLTTTSGTLTSTSTFGNDTLVITTNSGIISTTNEQPEKITSTVPITVSVNDTTIPVRNGTNSRGIIIPNSDEKKDNKTVIAILVSLLFFILLGFGVLGFLIYKKRPPQPMVVQDNQPNIGFDNPVYNHNYNNGRGLNEPLYEDNPTFEENDNGDYLHIEN